MSTNRFGNSMTTISKRGEFSFLLDNFGAEFFVGYFLAEFFHPKELITNFTLLNRRMRKMILQSSKLWKREFELMYPNLIGMVEDWIEMKFWNDEREERLMSFLKDEPFSFQGIFSNNFRNVRESDYKTIRTSCKSQTVHFMSCIILDHMFCETNFNSEYTWNQNSLDDFKYHRVNYSIYLKMFKFFYLLIETRQLGAGYDSILIDSINRATTKNKSINKLYKRLVTDIYLRSSFPCSAFYLFCRGYSGTNRYLKEEQEGIHSLPYIDFSIDTGALDPSFVVYPYVPLDKMDSEVTEFQCTILSLNVEHSLVYPRDLNKMITLFERFCAAIDENYYSFMITGTLERYMGLDNYIDSIKAHNVFHGHFRRNKCVNPSISARIHFQSQVDKYSKHVFEKFKGNGVSEELICAHLANFPSKAEVEHLFKISTADLFESIDNIYSNDTNELKKSFNAGRIKMKDSYRGTFKVDGFLLRSIDKCLRRYLHLYVFCEPTLCQATKGGSSIQKVVYNQMKNIGYPIFLMLLPHVSKMITLRIEQFIGRLSNRELSELLKDLNHCFDQLNFLNTPLIDISEFLNSKNEPLEK